MNLITTTRPRKSLMRCLLSWRKGLATVVVSAFLSMDCTAADAPSLEYQVKGACLIKFGMFVEWPTVPNGLPDKSPFIIGILGDDPFGKSFDESVAKEKVNGRQVVVRRAKSAAELQGCQIVFIASSETDRLSAALETISTNRVLTVSDVPRFAGSGGMVGFFKEGGKVRFEINTAIAERSGLKVSSKLLQVGRVVTAGQPDRG